MVIDESGKMMVMMKILTLKNLFLFKGKILMKMIGKDKYRQKGMMKVMVIQDVSHKL